MATRNPLGNLFGRSPIGPIQEHMQIAEEAAQFLPQLIQASIDDDWERAAHIHAEIVSAEREADKLKRSVRRHLPKSPFLPVPRSDLLELVALQDAVANTAKDIGVLMIGRKMRFPEKIEKYVIEFTATCVATVNQALLAIQELGLDHAKVNVHGGACAQGHPIGSTGSRIIVSLMYALQQQGKKRGVAALCIGGGEATAVGIELL